MADLRHRRAGGRDGGPVGDADQNAAKRQHPGEGDDKRGNLTIGHPPSVPRAEQQAHHQRHQNGERQRPAEPDVKDRRSAAQQPHHRANGEVDFCRNNHKHHADGEDAGDGRLAQQVGDIACAQVGAIGNPGEKQHNDDDGGDHHEDLEIQPF